MPCWCLRPTRLFKVVSALPWQCHSVSDSALLSPFIRNASAQNPAPTATPVQRHISLTVAFTRLERAHGDHLDAVRPGRKHFDLIILDSMQTFGSDYLKYNQAVTWMTARKQFIITAINSCLMLRKLPYKQFIRDQAQ